MYSYMYLGGDQGKQSKGHNNKQQQILNTYFGEGYKNVYIYTHRLYIDELLQHISTVFQCLQRKPSKTQA